MISRFLIREFKIIVDDSSIKSNNLQDRVKNLIKKFILKLRGSSQNVDIKKLKGRWWQGYFRIKIGKIRIILKYEDNVIFISWVYLIDNKQLKRFSINLC